MGHRFARAAMAALFLSGCLLDPKSGRAPAKIDYFPTSVEGLSQAVTSETRELHNGDSLDLTVTAVKKTILGHEVRMYAFNGSIPGPLLKVRQGDTLTLNFRNRSGFPLTLHPHGIRLDYHYDGAAGFSQEQVEDGKDFVYRLVFPDAGMFWYHSHVREDAFLAFGLYGNIQVTPKDSGYWNPVDREVPLVISEVEMDSNGMKPFRLDMADHAMMGRFGNVFLVNGDTDYSVTVKRNEYVRFYATNACNARVLNLVTNMHWMKVVGSDNGKYERSQHLANEFIAPGERLVYEVMFKDSGDVQIYHEMPDRYLKLGTIHVLGDSVDTPFGRAYSDTDTNITVIKDIDRFRASFDKAPDKELLFTGSMGPHIHGAMKAAAVPLPKEAATAHAPDGSLGIEWVDTMGTMNSDATPANMNWVIRDVKTGDENHAIQWSFQRGDQVLIRITNDSNAVHAMPHPIHFHGQRFLVVRVNGKPNPDLAWKDTYLVPAASTADLLLDASNPGGWMAHCHIAEHNSAGMMFHFRVND
jgi:FtsP/CotA-like multicopper oxidase with cupredoxin domain